MCGIRVADAREDRSARTDLCDRQGAEAIKAAGEGLDAVSEAFVPRL